MRRLFPLGLLSLGASLFLAGGQAWAGHAIRVEGTGFLLNDKPFPYTGVSFLNG